MIENSVSRELDKIQKQMEKQKFDLTDVIDTKFEQMN